VEYNAFLPQPHAAGHLRIARMNVLLSAQINAVMNQTSIEPEAVVKYYDSNKRKYTQVRVKAIVIAFSDNAASSTGKNRRALTEAEAKAKATKLLSTIRGGTDFVAVVKENSDDETPREKGGDYGTLHYGDNIPNAFRSAVFALKQGDVSEPLKQSNAFYLLRAEEIAIRPLSEVRDEVYNEMKLAHSDECMRKMDQEAKVQLVNPGFGKHLPSPAVAEK
jgi:parvulin-like peptidyl-prolyl isomerase